MDGLRGPNTIFAKISPVIAVCLESIRFWGKKGKKKQTRALGF